MVFLSKFIRKRQICVSEPQFGEVRGDARPWKAQIDVLFAFIELCSLRFRSYKTKCVQLGSFRRGELFCTQILPVTVVPRHSRQQKN